MKQNKMLVSGLLWLVASFILLWGLGSVPLTDVDEGAFAEASREMLSRGDFISPWLFDAPRFDKPAMIHWLQIAAMQAFGINAFAARLPSALAGLWWCWIVVRWTREAIKLIQAPAQAPQFVLVIAVTSIALPVISRVSTADALLNAFLTTTLYLLWRALMSDEASSSAVASLKKYTRCAAIFIGFGLLTKGPIAILVPAGASLFAIMMRPSLYKKWLKIAFDPFAWLIVLVIALPWYVLQYQAQGMPFIAGFFGKHNLGRYTGTMLGFSGGFWYYPMWMLISILPWVPMLCRSLVNLVRQPSSILRHPALRFMWAIPLFVLLFFSFSSTKLPHYGFYGLSGLFVLMAITAGQAHQEKSSLLLDRVWLGLLLLVFAFTSSWAPKLAGLTHDPYYYWVLQSAGAVFVWQWAVMTVIAAIGLVALFLPAKFGAWRLSVGAIAIAVCIHLIFVPTVIAQLRTPILLAAQQVAQVQSPVVSWRLASPSLSFAAQRVIPQQDPKLGDTVVLYEKHHQALLTLLTSAYPAAQLQIVWHVGGVEIVRVN
ncbi:MAG TPA: glycosyltransferase family 39 protein [Methylophilaceae bacterium]|jgi:4-amino-4-deoxy-L-arabinose transferase-like glycosyltransferase